MAQGAHREAGSRVNIGDSLPGTEGVGIVRITVPVHTAQEARITPALARVN